MLRYESSIILNLHSDKETKHHVPNVSEITSTYNCKPVLKLILQAAWQLIISVVYFIQIINEFFLNELLEHLNLFFKVLVAEPDVYVKHSFLNS